MVIPPLGDSQVDDQVQTFLGRHSVSRRPYFDSSHVLSATGTGGRDDEMEVDESDCVSSHPPSRSSSPSPSVHIGVGTRSNSSMDTVRLNRRHWRPWSENVTAEEGDDKMDVEDAHMGRRDLDIAGTCFDPFGARIYVATSKYVAEWRVNGAEKKWWLDDRWLV